MRQAQTPRTEKDLASDLERRLTILADEGRCEWRKEVRMICFAHAKDGGSRMLRADYVVKLDGMLVGFEVKATPKTPADLGRALVQCAEYSRGVIGAATVDRTPADWVGQALMATFLVSDSSTASQNVIAHAWHAHRLFGPANVGLFRRQCRHPDCFELVLCASRVWSREWGWNRGMINKTARVGNGSTQAVDTSEVVVPESWGNLNANTFIGWDKPQY